MNEKVDSQAHVNKGGIFFAARTRAGAITSAPFGVYHTKCESPQPYSEHYSLESAVDEANRLNMEQDK